MNTDSAVLWNQQVLLLTLTVLLEEYNVVLALNSLLNVILV